MLFQIDLHCRAGRDTDTPSLEQGNTIEEALQNTLIHFCPHKLNLCGQKCVDRKLKLSCVDATMSSFLSRPFQSVCTLQSSLNVAELTPELTC